MSAFFVVMYPGKCTQEIFYSSVMLILNLPAKVIPLFLRSLSYSWLEFFLGFVFPLLLNWLMLVRLLSKQIKVVYRCNVLVIFFAKSYSNQKKLMHITIWSPSDRSAYPRKSLFSFIFVLNVHRFWLVSNHKNFKSVPRNVALYQR